MYKYTYQPTAPMSHVSACFNHMTGLTKDCTFSTFFFACLGFPRVSFTRDPFDALNMFDVEALGPAGEEMWPWDWSVCEAAWRRS